MSPQMLRVVAIALNLAVLFLMLGLYRAMPPHQPGPYAAQAMEARQ